LKSAQRLPLVGLVLKEPLLAVSERLLAVAAKVD
jgi:hypothetical protein